MMNPTRNFCLLLFLILGYNATAQESLTEMNYRIWSVADKQEVSLAEMAVGLGDAELILFGEEHNDSVTHYLQAELFKHLYALHGQNLAISMEMFDRDVQVVMHEYLSGNIQEKHLVKDARVWSNYRDYRPMVEFAKEKGLDVICANTSSRYTNLAGRKGQTALQQLPKSSRKFLPPLPYPTAQGGYLAKLNSFMGGHTPAPADSTKPAPPPVMSMGGFDLVTAQSLWDASMAWSMVEYAKKKANRKKKILHLNGRFHSDEFFGVAAQLKQYAPKKKVMVISAGGDEAFPDIDWTQHSHLGNFIIITDPNVPKTYN